MKLQWIPILIFLLVSCQSNQIKESDNLKKGNQIIDSKEIAKEYEAKVRIAFSKQETVNMLPRMELS